MSSQVPEDTVLCVARDPAVRERIETALRHRDTRFSVLSASTHAKALETLDDQAVDHVVSGYELAGGDGIEFLEAVREIDTGIPFVLVVEDGTEKIESDAVSAGVSEYMDDFPDGMVFDTNLSRVESEEGTFLGVVGIARDITKAIEHEEQLEQQNERLNEFTSIVSHDLRNPLNVAEGRLELLREECESEHLREIEMVHTRMKRLIEDLLLLARDGGVIDETRTFDLSSAVEDCWRNVDTHNATLVNETDALVRGDEGRVQQLLGNLVRNAVEHGGASVTVTVGDLAGGFYVEDDGPGIPESERERVFESGYTTASGGTGLGLDIVRQIVDAHGWTVNAVAGTDNGARFEITDVETVD